MGMIGLTLGVIAILVMIVVLALLFQRANTVNLTGTGDEKPEWLREAPPAETLAAAKKEARISLSLILTTAKNLPRRSQNRSRISSVQRSKQTRI